jgi:hypothetical protein
MSAFDFPITDLMTTDVAQARTQVHHDWSKLEGDNRRSVLHSRYHSKHCHYRLCKHCLQPTYKPQNPPSRP